MNMAISSDFCDLLIIYAMQKKKETQNHVMYKISSQYFQVYKRKLQKQKTG